MSPIVPHFANECLEDLGQKSQVSWPKVNEKYLIKDDVKIVYKSMEKKGIMVSKFK